MAEKKTDQIEQKQKEEEGDVITFDEYAQKMFQEEKETLTQLQKGSKFNLYFLIDESKVCSYSKGAINQTLFGCKTCNLKKGGFCLACYLNCHLDHETFEIGLKRNFQCECGVTEVFHDPCTLEQNKEANEVNILQKNHNFDDKFCTCNQPYKSDEFMINCISCLDYFHLNHIELTETEAQIVQENDNLTEMICPECMKNRFHFLLKYQANKLIVFSLTEENQQNNQKESEALDDQINEHGKRSHQKDCLLKESPEIIIQNIKKPLFLVRNWYNYVCYCDDCQQLYKNAKLFEIEDVSDQNVIQLNFNNLQKANLFNEDYEQLTAPPAQVTQQEMDEIEKNYEKQFKLLIQENFVASSTIAHAVKNMKEKFLEFLKPFYESQEVVTPDHIQEFFQQFKREQTFANSFNN